MLLATFNSNPHSNNSQTLIVEQELIDGKNVGFKWTLYDLNMRIVLINQSTANVARISTYGLSKGTYLMKIIETDSENIIVKKVVIQ